MSEEAGTMQEPAPAEELKDTIDQALEGEVEKIEPEQETEPEEEETELSIEELKKQLEQANIEKEHWQKTASKHSEDVGRLRKLENQLRDLEETDRKLTEQESEAEYDTDKLVDIRADRKNIQSQKQLAQLELLKAQTAQKVPDFDELVSSGYMKEAAFELAQAEGYDITKITAEQTTKVLDSIRANPSQAISLASIARAKRKVAELTNQTQRTKSEVKNLAQRVSNASESQIVTNGTRNKKGYTTEQLYAMSSDDRKRFLEECQRKRQKQ